MNSDWKPKTKTDQEQGFKSNNDVASRDYIIPPEAFGVHAFGTASTVVAILFAITLPAMHYEVLPKTV